MTAGRIRTPWARVRLALLCAVLCAPAAEAQESGRLAIRGAPPKTGDLVRVDFVREIPGRRAPIRRVHQLTGLLAATDSTTWRLETRSVFRPMEPPQATRIAIADLERVRIHDGRSSSRGAWKGLAWGLGAGVVLAVVAGVDQDTDPPDRTSLNALWFIPAAAGGGALIGGAVKADVWRDHPPSLLFHPTAQRGPP